MRVNVCAKSREILLLAPSQYISKAVMVCGTHALYTPKNLSHGGGKLSYLVMCECELGCRSNRRSAQNANVIVRRLDSQEKCYAIGLHNGNEK